MATTTFNSWLNNVHDNDVDLNTLQRLQPNSNKLDDFVAAIQTGAQPADRDRLLLKLVQYFERWSNDTAPRNSTETIGEKSGTLLLIGFGFLVAAVLVY